MLAVANMPWPFDEHMSTKLLACNSLYIFYVAVLYNIIEKPNYYYVITIIWLLYDIHNTRYKLQSYANDIIILLNRYELFDDIVVLRIELGFHKTDKTAFTIIIVQFQLHVNISQLIISRN